MSLKIEGTLSPSSERGWSSDVEDESQHGSIVDERFCTTFIYIYVYIYPDHS